MPPLSRLIDAAGSTAAAESTPRTSAGAHATRTAASLSEGAAGQSPRRTLSLPVAAILSPRRHSAPSGSPRSSDIEQRSSEIDKDEVHTGKHGLLTRLWRGVGGGARRSTGGTVGRHLEKRLPALGRPGLRAQPSTHPQPSVLLPRHNPPCNPLPPSQVLFSLTLVGSYLAPSSRAAAPPRLARSTRSSSRRARCTHCPMAPRVSMPTGGPLRRRRPRHPGAGCCAPSCPHRSRREAAARFLTTRCSLASTSRLRRPRPPPPPPRQHRRRVAPLACG